MARWLFLLALLSSATRPGLAATYIIRPDRTGDYSTIQAAITAASAGDIVELTDGMFTGEGNVMIDFLGKAITVRSSSGDPQRTWIDAENTGRILLFQSAEGTGTVVQGIGIVHGIWSIDDEGGAVFCGPGTAPQLLNCRFWENASEFSGGGIFCRGASPAISDCVFEDNRTYQMGGAVYCAEGSSLTITRCVFDANLAGHEANGGSGGAIYCEPDCELTIIDSHFLNNQAQGAGGAIGGSWAGPNQITVTGSRFDYNTADFSGGGIAGDDVRISNTVFVVNTAAAEDGGAIACGSALSLASSTLCRNWAGRMGSGIACQSGSSVSIDRCIIAFGYNEEAISGDESTVTVRCCDIYGNEGGDWVGAIAEQLGQDGNICADPLFCGLESLPPDLTLQEVSPCRPFPPENPDCDLIGALPVACEETPTQETTWGGIKTLFR